jgi:hypothetical protein
LAYNRSLCQTCVRFNVDFQAGQQSAVSGLIGLAIFNTRLKSTV